MTITSSDLLAALGVTSLSFPRVTELPSTPTIGEVCFLTSANRAYIYTGSDWEILGVAPASASSSGSTTIVNNSIDPLPSQTGKSGKILSTNGTAPSWVDVPTGLPAQVNNAGKMLITDGTSPLWSDVPADIPELPPQVNNAGKILSTNGLAPSWIDVPTELPPQTNNDGKVLATNGIIASWVDEVKELPPQEGKTGKMLSTDGSVPAWVNVPVQPFIYDIAYSNPEQLPAASTLLYFAFPRAVKISKTFDGSYASAMGVFADTDISIRKNGVEVGIISFFSESGASVFSGTSSTDIQFAIGDIISFESGADANMIGVSIAVAGLTT